MKLTGRKFKWSESKKGRKQSDEHIKKRIEAGLLTRKMRKEK
jgi:hypothetical protein